MFKRVGLFLMMNLAIMLVLSVTASLLGFTGGVGKQLNLASVLGFAAVFGFGGAFISLALSKPMAKWSVGANPVDLQSAQGAWLSSVVERQSMSVGIAPPELCMYESDEVNAFATGARKNSALVAVSSGLLASMPKDQVEAVLAHEISHIANGDMVTMTLMQGVLNTFVIFIAKCAGWAVDRMILKNEDDAPGIGYYATSIVLELSLGILASVLMAWHSRKREFAADADAAKLTSAASMAGALRSIAMSHGQPLPGAYAAMGIGNGNGNGSKSWLSAFSTHPPIEDRIKALGQA